MMRRSGLAAMLAVVMIINGTRSWGQVLSDSELWQDVDPREALPRMITAAERVCSPQGSLSKMPERVPELEQAFIERVRPLIGATLVGVYGFDIPFWLERVTHLQSLKKYPDTLRAVIEVETYQGAHNPYGIDAIEFSLVPGPHLYVSRVEHRRHPKASP